MPNAAKLVLVLLALATSGCESCEGCNENESWLESARRAEPSGREDETGLDDLTDAGVADAAPPQGRASLKKSVEQFSESMKKLGKVIEAGTAAEKGDSPCERALTGFHGMYDYLEANAEPGEKLPRPPSSIVFVQVCESLPIEAQRCLVPSYAIEHGEECRRVNDELPEDAKARIRQITEFE